MAYRHPSDLVAKREDAGLVNHRAGLYGVFDGVSAAYSPSNPPVLYDRAGYREMTGGQAIASIFEMWGASREWGHRTDKAQVFLSRCNMEVAEAHRAMGFDVHTDDVAGGGFAVCGIEEDGNLQFYLGGDCFVAIAFRNGTYGFLSNFDAAADAVEKRDNTRYSKCLKEANGSRGEAWDLYFPKYRRKRIRVANRNIGEGGFATLNGDPALFDCMTREVIWRDKVSHVLLGTDGVLPSKYSSPQGDDRVEVAKHLFNFLRYDDANVIFSWRDDEERGSLEHIDGHPEATLVDIRF